MRTRVTLSFDDGHPNDLRLARLLKKHGLKATFYVPLANPENPLLTRRQLASLAGMGFEIGSHGASHARLHRMGEGQARRELFISWRELGRPRGFCFPGGEYHADLPLWAAQEGYDYCRTTRMFRQGAMRRKNLLHSSLQWYPHGWAGYLRHLGRRPNLAAALEFAQAKGPDLEATAKALFQSALDKKEPFHLWGHSYDLRSKGDWMRLEAFFEFLGRRRGVDYLSNAELFDALVPA